MAVDWTSREVPQRNQDAFDSALGAYSEEKAVHTHFLGIYQCICGIAFDKPALWPGV